MNKCLRFTLLFCCSIGNSSAQTLLECGSLDNAYGPFDYTNPMHFEEMLPRVEMAHFDRGVEQLTGHNRKANSIAMLAEDLDYTLRAFPNHHRALVSMMRYHISKVAHGDEKMRYSAKCYFDRAVEFAPKDATVRMIQGLYFYKTGHLDDALASYKAALELAPESAEVHYNAGLIYAELGNNELAFYHATIAYDGGFPLPGLRNKLKRLGAWKESPAPEN